MRVIELAEDDDGLLLSCDGGDLMYQEDKTGWHIKSGTLRYGDRLVVVPAGKSLPGDTNELTARIHDLEDTVSNLHATIEQLSKDLTKERQTVANVLPQLDELRFKNNSLEIELTAARAEPTVRELCRAYGEYLKRAERSITNTALEILPDSRGWIKSETGEKQILVKWDRDDNPVSIIDAACRPEPEPVEVPLVQTWTT